VVASTNYFAEIISWKTTTKFMERVGCWGYIFGGIREEGMAEIVN
jgi:hypothetical protein